MTNRDGWGEMRAGWRTLAGATLGMAVGASSLPFYTNGVFVPALEAAFGWSRTQLSLAAAIPGFLTLLCAPLVGFAVDRWGVRGPAGVGLAGMAIIFLLLAGVTGVYVWFFAIQVLMPFLAAGSTPIVFTRAVTQVFVRARGLALGISVGGIGLMAMVAPLVVSTIIQRYGWRAAYLTLALIILLAVPAVLLLLSDHRRPVVTAEPGGKGPALIGTAIRSPVFHRLFAAFFVLALGVCGYVLHLVPMLRDSGMSPGRAAAVQGLLGAAVLIGRLVTGALIDRIFAPYVAAVTLFITALGLGALALLGPALAIPAAILIGFALGAEVDLIGYLTAAYFGLALYGRLYGLLYSGFTLGVALSPLMISALRDSTGGYPAPLWVCSGLIGLAAVLFATAPRFDWRRPSSNFPNLGKAPASS